MSNLAGVAAYLHAMCESQSGLIVEACELIHDYASFIEKNPAMAKRAVAFTDRVVAEADKMEKMQKELVG